MSVFTDLWRQLVRRKLWPVALLLVAALAAVPVLLAKEPEPATAPPVASAPANGAAGGLDVEPVVTLAGAAGRSGKSLPLGDPHDIFKPTKKRPKVAKTAQDDAAETETPKGPSSGKSGAGDGGGGSSGDSTGGGTTPPAPTTPADEPDPPKTYPLYSLRVRFGSDGGVETRTLAKGSALPSAANPLVIYLGLSGDKKNALFLVDASLLPQGDGTCEPTPESCETLRLGAGETEFLDVIGSDGVATGSGFQLDLLRINKKPTTDAAKAARSARRVSVAKAARLGRTVASGLGGATRTG